MAERADRVHHHRYWRVLGQGLEPSRHRLDRDVGAGHEGQREDQQRQALCSLGVPGH